MTTSVIIATCNRARLLDDCLRHIARQRFEAGDEVIVVDNGSSDETRTVIASHAWTFPVPLRGLEERQPGKSRAVARALSVARGDVLAFTDDDVNVAADWLDAARSAMADEAVALVGGPVAPRWQRRAPWWLRLTANGYGKLAAPLALLDYGPSSAPLGSRTALGANLAVRREVMTQLGGFAPHLGKLRGTLLSGEDHELCRRVQEAGLDARYCPSMRVSHWVPAERARVRYFLAWFFWSGITHAALDANAAIRGRTLFGVPRYLIRRSIVSMGGTLAAAATGNATAAVERATDAAFAAGYAAARWRVVTICK